MKKRYVLPLFFALLLTFCGCGKKGPSLSADLSATRGETSSAETAQCSDYMNSLTEGEGLAEQLLSDPENEGIMAEVFGTMQYKVLSEEAQEDGTVLCRLEITAIDMEALLEDLPDDISSDEEAREAMLEMAEDAERKTFEAELILVPSDAEGGYEYRYGNDFVNAVTGGMLDLIIEAYDLEVAE